MLLGFSQGACLSLEFAARHARRYAAIIGLSGGLIGPPGTPRDYWRIARRHAGVSWLQRRRSAHPAGTRRVSRRKCFAGWARRSTSASIPRMGHTVNRDELDAVDALLALTRRTPWRQHLLRSVRRSPAGGSRSAASSSAGLKPNGPGRLL